MNVFDCPRTLQDTFDMYAKIFDQIFDSSIAEDFEVRYGFMDLMVLANSEGTVDMTAEAIARRTNVPLDRVKRYLHALSQPDPQSRSTEEEGRRIKLIDSHRSWGWQIINYRHYRELRDEAARREYFRNAKRKEREAKESAREIPADVKSVKPCPKKSTQGEALYTHTGDLPPSLEQAIAIVDGLRKLNPENDYTDAEATSAWNSLECAKDNFGRWKWGKNTIPPGDPRAALMKRMDSERDKKKAYGRGSSKQGVSDRNKGTFAAKPPTNTSRILGGVGRYDD